MAGDAARTTCPYCGVGCGIIARRGKDGMPRIEGDPDHPANFGKLCSKGLALAETLVPTGRLLYPQVNGCRVSWNDAISRVAGEFSGAIRQYGSDSVAFYVSGQLLTEDYYVANKLMKGFIGSANIDTNSRLCMASAVAGHRRAFGADIVPCNYIDLEKAELVVLVGSNLAWCHPVLFQRLLAARDKRGTKIVVVDPRRTATAEQADLFLQIRPQSDVALFNGLLRHLYLRGRGDTQFLFVHTSGLSEALRAAREWTVEAVSSVTALPPPDIEAFFTLFEEYPRTVTAFSMGVNQSASGTDKVNAIINVHLLTGRIGKEGAGPFSITGQPNAMGGREVGGLANMLAAHMNIEDEEHRSAVQRFWHSPRIADKPGLKAVDLFQAMHDGRIKALWIMGTNPAVSLPDSEFIAEALKRCDFVAVSDVMEKTETTQYAHVLLPAQGWGEKSGSVTNSERRISRQRGFMAPVGEAWADWHIICEVAKVMGFSGFDYDSPASIFAEHVALTRERNEGTRGLDLSAWAGINYDAMGPAQWAGARPFADGVFQTPDGRARFVPTIHNAGEAEETILNTGRVRDQWHTMTRTGLVPRLFGHRAEPHVELAPADAAQRSIAAADLVEVKGAGSAVLVRALVTDSIAAGQVFVPMHWNSSFASQALANAATAPDCDPVSGQPALKSASVRLRRYQAAWYGYGVSLAEPKAISAYFALRPLVNGFAFESADEKPMADWMEFIRCLDCGPAPSVVMRGRSESVFRCAAFIEGRLAFAFLAGDEPMAASREWLQGRIGREVNTLEILAGRPSRMGDDKGPIVCACMNVGRNEISRHVLSHGVQALSEVCEGSGAGLGCGSCRNEVQRIMQEIAMARVAAE